MVWRERQEYLGTKSEGHRSKMPEGAAAAVARDLHALGHSGANRMSMTGADGPVCCPEEPARGTAATGATSARYVLGGILGSNRLGSVGDREAAWFDTMRAERAGPAGGGVLDTHTSVPAHSAEHVLKELINEPVTALHKYIETGKTTSGILGCCPSPARRKKHGFDSLFSALCQTPFGQVWVAWGKTYWACGQPWLEPMGRHL